MSRKDKNMIAEFLIGVALLCTGGYTFASNVIVHTGFYSWRMGNMRMGGGLVVVPFIASIIMLFSMPHKFVSKLVVGIGLLLILTSIIMGTDFRFRSTSLYVYLLMLVGIFGGLALILKTVLQK